MAHDAYNSRTRIFGHQHRVENPDLFIYFSNSLITNNKELEGQDMKHIMTKIVERHSI